MVMPTRDIIFQLSANRLYYHDTSDRAGNVLLLNTVEQNREGFTDREFQGANSARRALHLLGHPSERDLGDMIRTNMIVNFPVTFKDDTNAKKIFGPDVLSLKVKSTNFSVSRMARGIST